MLRPPELMIALRYLRARQSARFASFISAASMLGVAIGVAALITILSVMNGFENELRARLLGMQSHATLTAAEGDIGDWRALRQRVLAVAGVEHAMPAVEIEAMANVDGRLVPVFAEGIAPDLEGAHGGIAASLTSGRLTDLAAGSGNVVLGRYLALELGVVPGDDVTLLLPIATPNGIVPRLRRLTVSGLFDSGVPEYDAGAAYLHWQDASALLDLDGQVTGLKLLVADVLNAPATSQALRDALGPDYVTQDWTEQNASYFRAIRLEKTMMALILTLVIAVAAFNIVASLVMVVTDKENDIAILRTLGMSPRGIVRVFLSQGLIIGWFGVLVGIGLGVALSLNVTEVVATLERALGFQVMPGDIYVMSAIPSQLKLPQVWWIAVVALSVTALATLYPARRAAAVHPAQALRYG